MSCGHGPRPPVLTAMEVRGESAQHSYSPCQAAVLREAVVQPAGAWSVRDERLSEPHVQRRPVVEVFLRPQGSDAHIRRVARIREKDVVPQLQGGRVDLGRVGL